MPIRRPKTRKFESGKPKRLGLVLTFGIFLFLSIFFWRLSVHKKVTVAINSEDGVTIGVFDFVNAKITSVKIPANTEINLADNLGTWKIAKAWEIGENENLKGSLLAQSVLKNFSFPVRYWADALGMGFLSESKFRVIATLFMRLETNLSYGQRIKMVWLGVTAKNTNRTVLKLSETPLVVKSDLVGGGSGYKVADVTLEKLFIYFNDTEFSKLETILLVDESDKPGLTQTVSVLTQMLGNKITLARYGETADYGCRVFAKNKKDTKMLGDLLGCEMTSGTAEDFDLEIYIGSKFL